VIVATLTSGNNVHPSVLSALAQWVDVIPGQQEIWKLLTAIQTQTLVAAEQGLIAQWRNIAFGKQVLVGMVTFGGDDGVDSDSTLPAADCIYATVDVVERISEGVRDLAKRD